MVVMPAPNALVIGAPKCGTTSLYFYLRDRHDIFVPDRKELHYFTYEELLASSEGPGDKAVLSGLCATRESYYDQFEAVAQAVRMDISPSYLYFDHVASRIKQELGDAKIVVMLRDPAEKAYSQYMHLVGELRETFSFEDALQAETSRREQGWGDMWRYAESSLYSKRLQTYLDVFGADSVHVILFEDFIRDSELAVGQLLRFLGADDSGEIRAEGQFNRSGAPRSKAVAKLLTQDSPVKSAVKALLPERLRMSLRMQVQNANNRDKEPMSESARSYLNSYFAEDVTLTAELLGRKLPWLVK
jgi:hypothetical protein